MGRKLIGALIGFPVGVLTTFFGIPLFGTVLFGRDFMQLAWVFLTFGLPIGTAVGVASGAKLAELRPRLFAITFVPLAFWLVGFVILQDYWSNLRQPRLFTVNLKAASSGLFPPLRPGLTNGKEFTGRISTDGVERAVKGTIPATLTTTGVNMDVSIEIIDGHKDEMYEIEITADDQRVTEFLVEFRFRGRAWTKGVGRWRRADFSGGVEGQEDRTGRTVN